MASLDPKQLVEKILDRFNEGDIKGARRALVMSKFALPEVTYNWLQVKLGLTFDPSKKHDKKTQEIIKMMAPLGPGKLFDDATGIVIHEYK